MWALRRAANPLRCQGYRLGASRVSCAKSNILSNDLEHGTNPCSPTQFLSRRCLLLLKRFYQSPSILGELYLRGRGLSSQTGAESSGEEDNLEDVFSELETPSSNTIEEKNAREEIDDELVSEPELLDDDSEEILEVSHNELELSDIEIGTTKDAFPKKGTTSDLFMTIFNTPRHLMNDALHKWVKEGNSLGQSDILPTMLNLRKRRMYEKALQLSEWLEVNKQLNFDEQDYASRLDLIAKVHGLYKAEKYIEKIPESFRGEVIYRTLLANYVHTANVKKAEELFKKMRDTELPITAFACNQLVLLYKRIDKKKIADVLLFMEKEKIKPTVFTYRLLIDTKGQSNDITGMEQVFETMKGEGIEPDTQTQALIARHYISAGLNEKAEAILKEMEGSDINENRGARKDLLPLYADLGKADEVSRIWNACEPSPQLKECQAAIDAWGKLGRLEEAEEVFNKMIHTWKRLSVKYYNSMLKVYADHKLLAKGKDLAKQMADSGCRIGPLTWDALVKLYVQAGEVEKAYSILHKASQKNQMKPLFSSYMTIMEQYVKRGDIHNTEKIFHRLKQLGYVIRLRQYQTLLQAYINAKSPAYGFRERMKADNIYPNHIIGAQLAQVDAFRRTAISDLID